MGSQNPYRDLLNRNGETFADEISEIADSLEPLDNEDREKFRDCNALAIARADVERLLIVAGPGAGKSFLFMSRIEHWLRGSSRKNKVYVSSFVRKLVRDLQEDVRKRISEDDQIRVTVSTLHSLARSLVERGHGSAERRLKAHAQVITGEWSAMVWDDVLQFHSPISQSKYTFRSFEHQLHTEEYKDEGAWPKIHETYYVLSQFYNAVGFADMIIVARQIVEERPELNEHDLWIFDEFQDFNNSEAHLIEELASQSTGIVIAGDDEQALYRKLKASLPEIIISYYEDEQYANAMLPFCSRCSYHVCLAASKYIATDRALDAIDKVYLPLKIDKSASKVQVVTTSTPAGAVDYIEAFVDKHRLELAEHVAQMEAGKETDPFLLILTPDKKLDFLRTRRASASDKLKTFLSQWSAIKSSHSSDYLKLLTYCRVAWDSHDNFALRKVLDYEGVSAEDVHPWLRDALDAGWALAAVDERSIKRALRVCDKLRSIVEDESLSAAEIVVKVSNLVDIADQEKVTEELTVEPINWSSVARDEEAEEAIQTAGAMAPVEMMSIVGSKGLSAHHVIIIGCDDVNLKHTDRLAFFVGLTRARKSLHLIASMKSGGSKGLHPHLAKLPRNHCEYLVYKKTGREREKLASISEIEDRIGQWNRAAGRR